MIPFENKGIIMFILHFIIINQLISDIECAISTIHFSMGNIKKELFGDNLIQMPADLADKIKNASSFGTANWRINDFISSLKFTDEISKHSTTVALKYQAFALNNILCETYKRSELGRFPFKDMVLNAEVTIDVPHLYGKETYRIVKIVGDDISIICTKFVSSGQPKSTEHNRYVKSWKDV